MFWINYCAVCKLYYISRRALQKRDNEGKHSMAQRFCKLCLFHNIACRLPPLSTVWDHLNIWSRARVYWATQQLRTRVGGLQRRLMLSLRRNDESRSTRIDRHARKMRTYSYGGNKEDTINYFWTNTGGPRQTGHCGDKRRILKDPSSSTSKLTSPVLSIATHPVAKHFLDVMSVVFVNKRLLVVGIWTCFEENDWCQIEKPLKMWPFPCSLDPSTLSDLRSRLTGNQGSARVSFWREGKKACVLELSVQNHTHTHTHTATSGAPQAISLAPHLDLMVWSADLWHSLHEFVLFNVFIF